MFYQPLAPDIKRQIILRMEQKFKDHLIGEETVKDVAMRWIRHKLDQYHKQKLTTNELFEALRIIIRAYQSFTGLHDLIVPGYKTR